MLVFKSCLLLIFLNSCSAFFFHSSPEWDGLRLTFGLNPFNSNNFAHMPRTIEDAKKAGYKLESACDSNATFRGARYVKGNDRVAILLFDKNGYIAGIQTEIPGEHSKHYPDHLIPPFTKVGDRYVMTAYFINPAKVDICNVGRTAEEFKTQGTGTDLFIQNGPVAETDKIAIPHKESAIAHTKWTKGKCFPSMGMHYWYNLSDDMNCQNFFPVFLLYHGGKLNGLGWAFLGKYSSGHYEHPSENLFSYFMASVPQCLKDAGTVSTMHIYLTDSVHSKLCF